MRRLPRQWVNVESSVTHSPSDLTTFDSFSFCSDTSLAVFQKSKAATAGDAEAEKTRLRQLRKDNEARMAEGKAPVYQTRRQLKTHSVLPRIRG